MDKDFLELLKQYDYQFPSELIAQEPAKPRDAARLMIYDRKSDVAQSNTFNHLDLYFSKDAVIVFNDTRVIPARLLLCKPTGGQVEILYLNTISKSIRVMSNRHLRIGEDLSLTSHIFFTVTAQEGRFYILEPSIPIEKLHAVFDRYGITPLPPYIKHSALHGRSLRSAYQTIFARHRGSIAAPTASLHFTKRLLSKIRARGIAIKFVTLHVNLGTFTPLTEGAARDSKLHSESYHIDAETAAFLNRAKRDRRPIIAVGTTVARTLESASNKRGVLSRLTGETDLFIREGYQFRFVNELITNFHVPKSSLLMLVAAFIGREKLFSLYERAIAERFRLFSFGDGMYLRALHVVENKRGNCFFKKDPGHIDA